MKKEWIAAGVILGILGALLAVFLPLGRELALRLENRQLVLTLGSRVEEMTDRQRAREQGLAKWYNWNLGQQGSGDWQESYAAILNLERGALGVLELPGRELPICHGTAPGPGRAGHDPASMLPMGSAGSHTVLFLAEEPALEAGMELRLRCLDRVFRFRVQSIQRMPGEWSTDMLCLGRNSYLTLVVDKKGVRTLIRCMEIREESSNIQENDRKMGEN